MAKYRDDNNDLRDDPSLGAGIIQPTTPVVKRKNNNTKYIIGGIVLLVLLLVSCNYF